MKIPPGFGQPFDLRSPFTVSQAVSWGEMDAYGHVNNAAYLSWIENARFYYFEHVGINATYEHTKIGPILVRLELDYSAPVRFPDTLLVTCTTQKLGNSSFTLEHKVWTTQGERMCLTAKAVIVMVDYRDRSRAVRVPDPIRAALCTFEGTDIEA